MYNARIEALAKKLRREPNHLDIVEHFAEELRAAAEIREYNRTGGTVGVRERNLKNIASKFTKMATAQELDDGVTVFGWAVDTHAAHNNSAGAIMWGGGDVFEDIIRTYGDEIRPIVDKMTARLSYVVP